MSMVAEEYESVTTAFPRVMSKSRAADSYGGEPVHGRNTTSNENVQPQADPFEGMIGRSDSIRTLCDQVSMVAPTNSTALILGETGTGKELIARAIHNRSSRQERNFIRVNCAAIPAGLIESELFGHERGAFTGALARRFGRFEMADKGTIFLDEVGDFPLELQPKLLRVLQEQEFERIGSTQTTHVNVRIVAATSRDLPSMVANREFRADLYYRLNVFPIWVPPLRERRDDIPLLVQHFVGIHARRMNKCIQHISGDDLAQLQQHAWAGNIRELQNVVERAVILCAGTSLSLPLDASLRAIHLAPPASQSTVTHPGPFTFKDMERQHIIEALKATNWVLGGPRGAGARLGLPRTTLIAKMQRLGITRSFNVEAVS